MKEKFLYPRVEGLSFCLAALLIGFLVPTLSSCADKEDLTEDIASLHEAVCRGINTSEKIDSITYKLPKTCVVKDSIVDEEYFKGTGGVKAQISAIRRLAPKDTSPHLYRYEILWTMQVNLKDDGFFGPHNYSGTKYPAYVAGLQKLNVRVSIPDDGLSRIVKMPNMLVNSGDENYLTTVSTDESSGFIDYKADVSVFLEEGDYMPEDEACYGYDNMYRFAHLNSLKTLTLKWVTQTKCLTVPPTVYVDIYPTFATISCSDKNHDDAFYTEFSDAQHNIKWSKSNRMTFAMF